ncbi:uncharacterized protein [Euphorbia lathyris]|uniref:uncharacterized protein isoform X2 n=1 Tax=Euphorbia lathyris TaxID=212925 RepID=UPI00331428DD
MDPTGSETGQWTNEKHLHFLNSMEAAFVHTMLEDNGRSLRLDRYMPDSSESTLDLKSQRPKKQSISGYNNGGRRSRIDRRTKRLSSSDHQSQPSDASQDQVGGP